jgi:hypothetical protein
MRFNLRSHLNARTSGRALVAALAVAGAAHADGSSTKAVLSAYEETAGGVAIARGDYAATVSQLAPHGASYKSDRVAASTNLCVAYIMTRQWETAHAACDTAISLAQQEPADATLFGRRNHAEAIAVAYSNRAVLNWLEAQPQSAASDMAQARALSPWSDFVAHNTAVLGAVKSAAASTVAEAR